MSTDYGECKNLSHSPRQRGAMWSCPDCDAARATAAEARALAEAKAAARSAGAAEMALATQARPDERSRVEAAIRQLAATGKPFSANDARAIHGIRGGVVGATFNAPKAEGLIEPVGDEVSTDKATHGHRIFRWIGTHATGAAA